MPRRTAWAGLVPALVFLPACSSAPAPAAKASPPPSSPALVHSAPPRLEQATAPGPAPEGMVYIPGGEFSMGAEEKMLGDDARPVHRVHVDPFWMDETEVTNEQFEKFVAATGYVTVAERVPRAEDFPGAPPENLVAGAVVFTPPSGPVPLDSHFRWWSYVKGASWRHPEGPKKASPGSRQRYPVVQVAWADAAAYAAWAGKRLPTEAEWEFAARGGLDRKPYTWGDDFRPEGKFMANSFQGHFPDNNTDEDGYRLAAPVCSYAKNPFGLCDMAGNVWEWVADWYRPDYFATLAAAGLARNPQGPPDSFDPSEPGVKKRVHKGGSFLCTDQYCSRYMPGGRGKGDPDTGTDHLGFRCVKSGP